MNASLIGTTVQFSNDACPELSRSFVVGSGSDVAICYAEFASSCLLGYSLDVGADFVAQISFNRLDQAFPVLTNTNTLAFAPSMALAGFEILQNTYPNEWEFSVAKNIYTETSMAYTWGANSLYQTNVRLALVPEPTSLLLLGTGLGSLLFLRRKNPKRTRPDQ